MASKKACSIPAENKARQLGMDTFAKYAVRNMFPRAEEHDVWSPPRLVRHHVTYLPPNVCGMVVPNDLISMVSSNVLHVNDERTSQILPSDLEYWTRPQSCHVCADGERDARRICVVCTTDDVRVLEQTVEFDGHYHVLGRLPEADGQGRDATRTTSLLTHIASHLTEDVEVILALGNDEKGEAAASYITDLLGPNGSLGKGVKITKLDHVRQGDAEALDSGKAPCAICGIQTPTVQRSVEPGRAKIAWCGDTRLEVLVHDSFRVPNEEFDNWCENFNDPPSQGLHADILQAIRENTLNVFEIPYTHTGYMPDQKGWINRWTDNVERIFRDMRSNSRISSDNKSYGAYPRAKRSFSGFCGFRDPLNRNDPGRLTWFFFGQFESREESERTNGRRGWVVFIQIGILQALCAAFMAELVDGTFEGFLKRWGLIIPNECFARDDKDARKRQQRQERLQRKQAPSAEVHEKNPDAEPEEAAADDGQNPETTAADPQSLEYDQLFGADVAPQDADGGTGKDPDAPSDTN